MKKINILKFTKKELKLIKESLMAYGVGEDEEDSKIYDKIYKLINKPVTTTNEQPEKFHLTYSIPDSGRDSIKDINEKIILFDSIKEAKDFRKKNDFTNIHDEAYYWIKDDESKEPSLQYCYIELYGG
jgi:hypothetical protein